MLGMVDCFLDHLFEDGEFDRLGDSVGDREFCKGAFVL